MLEAHVLEHEQLFSSAVNMPLNRDSAPWRPDDGTDGSRRSGERAHALDLAVTGHCNRRISRAGDHACKLSRSHASMVPMKPVAARIAAMSGEGALSVYAQAKELERQGRSIAVRALSRSSRGSRAGAECASSASSVGEVLQFLKVLDVS